MKRIHLTLGAVLLLLVSIMNHMAPACAEMVLPIGLSFYPYNAEATPLLTDDPASAHPVAVGSLAEGGDGVTLQVGLNSWAGPVDIYLGAQILAYGPEIFLFLQDGSLQASSQVGLLPWRVGITDPVTETLLGGNIPVSTLPPGVYRLFLGVSPEGSMNHMYLWQTEFQVAHAPGPSDDFEITIEVAPSTLNIQSLGQVVTVRTDLAYSRVEGDSVTLNDIKIAWWEVDDQGNFVAKFEMSKVKELADSGGLVVPGENELTLTGATTDGAKFTGAQMITVINVGPAGS